MTWRGVVVTGRAPLVDGCSTALIHEPGGQREHFGGVAIRPPWVSGSELASGLALGWLGAANPRCWRPRYLWARLAWALAGRPEVPMVLHASADECNRITAIER